MVSQRVGDAADDARNVLVQDGDALPLGATGAQADGREVDGVRDVAVLDVVDDLAHSHDGAVLLGLGGRSAQMRQNDGVLHAHDGGVGEVGDVTAQLALAQSRGNGLLVDERVAREIEQHGVGLHERDLRGADHALRGIHGRHVDGDVVALGADVVEARHVVYILGKAPSGVDRHVGVVAVHVHAQLNCSVGNKRADGAQADDAELLAQDLAAGKRLLGLLGGLGDVLVVGVLAAPGGAVDDAAAGQEHAAQHELLHRVGVGAGGVEHDDALVGAALERDVVHARAGAADGQQALGELGLVQLRAAYEHAVGLREVVDKFVSGGQLVGTLLRNIVQAMDTGHFTSFRLHMYSICTF